MARSKRKVTASSSKPYDTVTRELLETYVESWMAYMGLEGKSIQVKDADISTFTAASDKVFQINDPDPWMLQVELQSGFDLELPERAAGYNILVKRRHRLPVLSVIILLRRDADGPHMSGYWEERLPDGTWSIQFQYKVIRVWEYPVEDVLAGGLGTLPLAPLSNVQREDLPHVIRRMEERIGAEAEPAEAGKLWSATYLLMGLRYPPEMATELLKGAGKMKESSTYQAILIEGRTEEAKAIIFRLGNKRFGAPDAAVTLKLQGIGDLRRMEQLSERLLDVSSWEQLLQD